MQSCSLRTASMRTCTTLVQRYETRCIGVVGWESVPSSPPLSCSSWSTTPMCLCERRAPLTLEVDHSPDDNPGERGPPSTHDQDLDPSPRPHPATPCPPA